MNVRLRHIRVHNDRVGLPLLRGRKLKHSTVASCTAVTAAVGLPLLRGRKLKQPIMRATSSAMRKRTRGTSALKRQEIETACARLRIRWPCCSVGLPLLRGRKLKQIVASDRNFMAETVGLPLLRGRKLKPAHAGRHMRVALQHGGTSALKRQEIETIGVISPQSATMPVGLPLLRGRKLKRCLQSRLCQMPCGTSALKRQEIETLSGQAA